jgi:hypothetical protein
VPCTAKVLKSQHTVTVQHTCTRTLTSENFRLVHGAWSQPWRYANTAPRTALLSKHCRPLATLQVPHAWTWSQAWSQAWSKAWSKAWSQAWSQAWSRAYSVRGQQPTARLSSFARPCTPSRRGRGGPSSCRSSAPFTALRPIAGEVV